MTAREYTQDSAAHVSLADVHVNLADVVPDDVEHNEHVSGVASLNQRLKIGLAAEVGVEAIKVLHPVAVIAVGSIGDHRADPYCIEPHACATVGANIGKQTRHADLEYSRAASQYRPKSPRNMMTGQSMEKRCHFQIYL